MIAISVQLVMSNMYYFSIISEHKETTLEILKQYALKVFLCSHVFRYIEYNPWTAVSIIVIIQIWITRVIKGFFRFCIMKL
jgi:hypothetical protein